MRKAAAARRRAAARSLVKRIADADPARLFGGVSPYALSHRAGPAWPSARAPRDLFGRLLPGAATHAVAEADQILAGRVRLFGRVEDLSRGTGLLDWSFHPHDERREFFATDPKFPWEVARHAVLPRLGVAWYLTRDPRYAERAAALILDWAARFSQPEGLPWESALEVGIRLIAWCQAFHFFRSAPAFKDVVIETLLRHIAAMAAWLDANLSTDRVVAGNHLLGELAGVIVADLYFPEMRERARLARNLRLFSAEVTRQVAPDGVSLEQSSTYGRFVADFVVAVLATARATGTGVPKELLARAGALAGWLASLSLPEGPLPLIGDNDDGKGVDWGEPQPSRDARGVVMALATLVDDPGPLVPLSAGRGGPAPGAAGAAAGRRPPGAEITFWWMGEEGLKRLEYLLSAATARGAAPLVRHFSAGGHAVIRSGPDFVHVRCGPFGHGLPKPSAHSHADWMSPVVTLFGHAILVDPGNFGYTTAGAARDLFRSDAAHSLFRIDDRPLAVPDGTFRWLEIPAPGRLDVVESDDEIRVTGAWMPAGEAGYKAVACTRTVVYNKIQQLISIRDEWSGNVSQRIAWHWRLPPGSRPSIDPAGGGFEVHLPDGARFHFELDPVADIRVEEGWVAPHYGERLPAPIAVVERSAPIEPDGRQITVIRFLSGSGEMPA